MSKGLERIKKSNNQECILSKRGVGVVGGKIKNSPCPRRAMLRPAWMRMRQLGREVGVAGGLTSS